MSVTDGGENRPADNEPGRGRAVRVVIGATALAAALGVGAYVITDRVAGERAEPARTGALATPDAGATSARPAPSGTASPSPASASHGAATQAVPPDVQAEIAAAREQMRKDGVKVQHPVTPSATVEAADIKTTTEGSLQAGGIVRLVTARGDLTGQRELGWVSGGVHKQDGVPCSQTVRFSSDAAPQRKANLMICWRTSPKKSVVAVVVDPKGHPSAAKAVDALQAKWSSMG